MSGGQRLDGLQPSATLVLERLLASLRAGEPLRLGNTWRLRAGRWPEGDASDECLLLEAYQAEAWLTVIVVTPAGTIITLEDP